MNKIKNPRKDTFDNESPKYIFQISIFASEDIEIKLLKTNFSSSYPKNYWTTVGIEPVSKTIEIHEKNIKLHIFLHSLEERFSSIYKRSAKNSDAIILIYNISNTKTLNKMLEWSQMIKNTKKNIPILLVRNKFDLEENREVSKERIEEVKESYDISLLMEISLKTGENVEEMFRNLTTMLLKKYKLNID
ncbi:MAG: Rab family GTPase [Promethearchaeota archaeon]|jgi:small GTP-binding protein